MLTNANTFIQKIIYMMRDSQLCFRNTDATLMQTLQYMKNVSMKAQKSQPTPHVGNTMKDDIEIYGGWWSQVKLKDHKSKNNFKKIIKESKWSHHEESMTTS